MSHSAQVILAISITATRVSRRGVWRGIGWAVCHNQSENRIDRIDWSVVGFVRQAWHLWRDLGKRDKARGLLQVRWMSL
jgi:hypothetical protein